MHICFTNNKKTYKRNNIFNLARIKAVFAIFLTLFAFFIAISNNNGFVVYAESGGPIDYEKELEGATEDVLEDIDFDALEVMLEEVDVDFLLFGGYSFKEYVGKIIKGEEVVDLKGLLNIFVGGALNSLKEIISPLVLILMIALLFCVFDNFKANKISGVGEVVYFICFALVAIILTKISSEVIMESKESLSLIKKQMGALFPILLSLMSLMGGNISVGAYSPMFAFLTNTVFNIFYYILLPLFILSLILQVIGSLSKNYRFDKLNGFVSSLFKWIIGVTFAVYMAFLSLNGLTAGSADGISVKATKYAIKNYIPMLGGYISDGFQLVKAGGLLVKNATGLTGIIMLLGTIITPVLSVAVIELGLKLVAGIVEVVGDKKSSNLLFAVSKSFKLLVVVLVGLSLMYFFTVFLTTCSVSNIV